MSASKFHECQNSVDPFFYYLASTPEIPQIPMSSPDPVELPRPQYATHNLDNLDLARSMNNQADYEIRYFRKIYIRVVRRVSSANFI